MRQIKESFVEPRHTWSSHASSAGADRYGTAASQSERGQRIGGALERCFASTLMDYGNTRTAPAWGAPRPPNLWGRFTPQMGGLVGVWGANGYLRLPTLISSATEKRS